MNTKPAWACALSTFIVAGTAHAQAAAPQLYPQQYLAHISIQASSSTELEVVPKVVHSEDREDWPALPAVAHCTEYCDFWALPGKYTLYAKDHSGGERKELSLRIKQSNRFLLEAGDDGARTTGLVFGVLGAASLLAGFVLIMPQVMSEACEGDCHNKSQEDAAMVGLGLLVIGAIATPVGWSMFAHNGTRLKPIDYRASEPTRQARVGVVGFGRGGLGLAGVVSF